MYYAGLDLGQRRDHSALAIVERRERGSRGFDYAAWRESRSPERAEFVVRYLERVRLGTPYVEVVRRVVDLMKSPALAAGRRLVVDATGVGAPMIEMLRAAASRVRGDGGDDYGRGGGTP